MMGSIKALRLTEHLDFEDECRSWYEWLKARGVPVAIIAEDNHYAVWRQGVVRRKASSKGGGPDYYDVQCGPEKIKADYRIIESANGFTGAVGQPA